MKLFKRFHALQGSLLLHELSFVVLILLTAGIGIAWAFAWQQSSTESMRLSVMNTHTQNIRGELYRQLKEVFDASFLQDENAAEEYDQYTQHIHQHLQQLMVLAQDAQEATAVKAIAATYKQFHQQTFTLLGLVSLNPQQKYLLNNQLEKYTFTGLENAFNGLEKIIQDKQQRQTQTQDRWLKQIIWLAPIPVLLAVSLLLFARRFVRRNVIRPLGQVINGAKRISTGDLQHAIAPCGADELIKLADAINAMALELAENRDKLIESREQAALGELIPMVAHNIRNPLAGIRAASQVTLGEDISSATRDALTDIIVAVDRLERWVTSLLSYLHPLTPHFSLSALTQVADNALSLIDLQLADKQLSLCRQGWEVEAAQLEVDINLLEQTICNLVQNAIEASPANTTIELQYWQSSDKVGLTIKDQGQGMNYDPLAQPRSLTTNKSLSCGLGIPFAQKVIKLHQGELRYYSKAGQGTDVEVILPLNRQ